KKLNPTKKNTTTHTSNNNKPILKPDHLKSMKVRIQPSPGAVEMIKVMGGNPTPLDYGELYTALQQGVVDMAENSVMALTTMR
ncbi:TRAP transporter substrate-binding protein DctP, partial [Escherichia coli]|nr:TRAP transporter substrate-binding protein DctP [Escherichia coli]